MDNPELYHENNQLQQHGVEKFLDFFGEQLRKEFGSKDLVLLDVGSGDGKILTDVVIGKSGLKFSKVIGVDVSQEMLRYSQAKYCSELVSFQFMDAGKEIPENLKNQQFDIVSSFYCLHWIGDLNAAFGNIHDLLKPNGIFCFIIPQYRNSNSQTEVNDKHLKYLVDTRDELASFRLSDDPANVIRRLVTENRMELIGFIDIPHDEYEYGENGSFAGF